MFNSAVYLIGIATILLSIVGHADAYYSKIVGSYSASNTNSAQQETWNAYFGWFPAGTTVRIGTCKAAGDLSGASYSGDTFLRLFRWDGSGWGEIAANDDNIGDCGFRGSYLVYTLPYDMDLEIRAGCYSSTSCSGTIVVNVDMDSSGSLSDVVAAFHNLASWASTTKPWWYSSAYIPDSYTKPWYGDGSVPFQGMQRLRSWGQGYYHASWFAISGSGWADLFFPYLAPNIAPTESISAIVGPADSNHSSVRVRRVAQDYVGDKMASHFGGSQTFGHYLAAGLEKDGKSNIQFWDVNDPYGSRLLYSFIGRANGLAGPIGPAAAVGIAKIPGLYQPFIMAVAGADSNRIDFYRNNTGAYGYAKAWGASWQHLCTVSQSNGSPFEGYFQSIALVAQDDGQLFLVGLRSNGTDVEGNGNRARLYHLGWNGSCYSITLEAAANFGNYSNTSAAFNAAAGVYVDAQGDRMAIYSMHGYRPDKNPGTLSVIEFRGP